MRLLLPQFLRRVLFPRGLSLSPVMTSKAAAAAAVAPRAAASSSSPSRQSPRPKARSSQSQLSAEARSQGVQQKVRALVPQLDARLYKGQCGRVCVFGGCFQYTGAPYFAAISALRTGCDLVHVICEQDAGQVIKSYSPELIVHPVLDTEYALEEIDEWLPRFHAVVLGPGLGRNQSMQGRISIIFEKVKAANLPLVVDADGLWYLTAGNGTPAVVKGYRRAVLTPNAMEFARLARVVLKDRQDMQPNNDPDVADVAEVARALGGVTIVHKGSTDVISDGNHTEKCVDDGSPRRCGGQGDLLSGAAAVFMHWCCHGPNSSSSSNPQQCPDPGPGVLAGWAAARLARACAAQAFALSGRATITTDLIEQIQPAFQRLYESETCI